MATGVERERGRQKGREREGDEVGRRQGGTERKRESLQCLRIHTRPPCTRALSLGLLIGANGAHSAHSAIARLQFVEA